MKENLKKKSLDKNLVIEEKKFMLEKKNKIIEEKNKEIQQVEEHLKQKDLFILKIQSVAVDEKNIKLEQYFRCNNILTQKHHDTDCNKP